MPDLTNVFPSCVLNYGPLEGERVLGMWIMDRIGPVRYSFRVKAERALRHFQRHHPNNKATILEENRVVKGRKDGPVFFIGVELKTTPTEERE